MPPPTSDLRQHLEIETPEHVVLDLELAGLGSRLVAALIDNAIIAGLLLVELVLVSVLAAYNLLPAGSWAGVAILASTFLLWNGYYLFFEGLRGGRTPGKRRMGLRVVRDTGHPITFGDAVVRNLLRTADSLPPPYLTGLLLIALHPRAKRLGDLAAGTVVVRDRPMEAAPRARSEATHAQAAAAALGAPVLSDNEFSLVAHFAARAAQLPPAVRDRLASDLIRRLGHRVPVAAGSPAAALVALHASEVERRRGRLAGRGGVTDRFVARQQARWAEFETLARRAAREGLDRFRPDELPEFAARYREIAADLARARTYRADPATIAWLERLAAAGHNALYRDERATWRSAWRLVAYEFPAAVLQSWRIVLLAFGIFTATATAGFLIMRDRPALAEELLPDVMLERAEEGHARVAAGRKYGEVAEPQRPAVATFIITNNIRVAMGCFAGGIFLGVGSLVVLAFNGIALGMFAGHFANEGLLGYLLEFVVGHGVLELTAIWIASGAGFLLGRAVIAPGDLRRGDALVVNGRIAVRMLGMTVVLLAAAGLIEGFLSVSGTDWLPRTVASGASLIFLVVYLANGHSRANAYSPRSMARIRMAKASISRRLAVVSGS